MKLQIKNSGEVAGHEIVQLYVRDVDSTVFRPDKELKGFTKVYLEPGEEQEICFTLDKRSFAYFEVALRDWHVESGVFEILIGASSRDIRLKHVVQVESTQEFAIDPERARKLQPYYELRENFAISQETFEALCKHPMPNNHPVKGEPFTINTPLGDMRHHLLGRLLYSTMQRQAKSLIKDDEESVMALLMSRILEEAPLRLLIMMSRGAVSYQMIEALLSMMNGRFIRGIIEMVRAIRER